MAILSEEDTTHELDTLRSYLKRRQVVENEIQILKDDLKQLDEEFKEKVDLKSLKLAMSVAKSKARVAHKFTFENFLNVVENEGWVD